MRVPWNEDEAIIIVDAFYQYKNGIIKKNDAIKSVSARLREMAIKKGLEIDDVYRNENGITMQMATLEHIFSNGEKGLRSGSKLFRDVMLEGAINGLNSAEDALSDPALVQEFKRREYVIVMMADEYASFRRHLHALSVKEQEIIIPLLKQEKDYYTLAEEAGVTVPVVRRKASRIHCELISYMENYFIEKL